MMEVQDAKVAVVTGANRGIGLGIVRRLCMEFQGVVYLTSRDETKGREAVAKLEMESLNSKPRFYQLDISSRESIETLKTYLLQRYGGIDVLVNNAGVMYGKKSPLPLAEQAVKTLEINFDGTLTMLKIFIPLLRPHGRIVNVSSTACRLSNLDKESLRQEFSRPDLTEVELIDLMEQFVKDVAADVHREKGWPSAYEISKVAVTALTKIHARELANSGNLLTFQTSV